MVEHQVLEERYIDKEKLFALLRSLFGVGNFAVEVSQSVMKGTSTHKSFNM